jgi:hypothetical protein
MLSPSLFEERGKAACGLRGELFMKYNIKLFPYLCLLNVLKMTPV